MLNLVRKHADSWMIKTILWTIVFAFVVTIFFGWGMGGPSSGRSGVVAVVDGEEIFLSEFDQSFNNLINFYRQQFPDQFSEKLIERLNLRSEALDRLILSKLMLVQADRLDIRVSNEELATRIRTLPAFKKDDNFDQSRYQNFLNFNRLTPREFEDNLRQQVRREKVENFIKSNIKISPDEVREAFREENEKVKLSYVSFSKQHFENTAPPSEEDLQQFFEKHKADFEIPERVVVQYVRLTPQMVADQIKIRDEDLEDYYQTHQAEFHVKKQYQASHILFRVKPSPGDSAESKNQLQEAEKAAKAKAEAILKKIEAGEDFAEMAKKHSGDTVSGAKGGDLGQFTRGTMVPEFEETLERLKPGQVEGPVKTTFGYHLIRLDKVEEARVKPLAEVRDAIVKKLKARKGKLRILRAIRKIHKAVQSNGDLAAAAQAAGYEAAVTPPISRKDHSVPGIGVVPEFFNLAFTLKDNTVSQPLETPEAAFLLKVTERKPPETPALEAVKDKVEKKLKEERSREATRAKFEEFQKLLADAGDLKLIAGKSDLQVLETPFFSRADSIPGMGNIKAIKDKAFLLKPEETSSGESRFAYFLIKLKERQEAGEPEPGQLAPLRERLKTVRGNEVFRKWLEDIRKTADIQIDRELIGPA